MSKKTTLKEWVHELMTNNPSVTPGPTETIALANGSTGETRIERIRKDWWDDYDFRCGYEALRADEGFEIVSEVYLDRQSTDELETFG